MDELTAFERQLAGGLEHLGGAGRRVDPAAMTRTVATTTPKRRFQTMLSALKFAVASAIVALFGGLLLAVLLARPSALIAPGSLPVTSDDRILLMKESGKDCATIHTILPDGSGLTDIPGDCVGQAHARWEPSRTSIILDRHVSDAQRAIFRLDLATGEATQLSTTGPWDWRPAASPDGSMIAFDRSSDVRGLGIVLMDADGSDERLITTVPAAPDPRDEVPDYSPFDEWPSFSPDGSELVFVRILDYNPARFQAALFVVGIDGEGLRQLTDWMTSEPDRPSWSPDGSTILFDRDGSLWTIRPDGTGLAELRPSDWSAGDVLLEPDWSPDGSRILFKRRRPGWDYNELWTVEPDGSDPALVLRPDAGEYTETPDW